MKIPARWTVAEESLIADCHVFKVFREHNVHPIDGREGDFFVLHAPAWVTCAAVTEDGKFILEQQYRHGFRELSWEFPGGMVDPGEDPSEAAARELREETGYAGSKPVHLAAMSANPALLNNRSHIVLIENCKKISDTCFDANEEISTITVSPPELLEFARSGKIHHSIMLAVIGELFLHRPDFFSL